jgi:parvulin-like peptidyl-prolyl isomerase
VRVDGRAIADVAAACAAPLRRVRVYLGDAEPALSSALLTAQPGELIGPVSNEDAYVLLAVNDRTPPAPTDPELRRRAETLLVQRAVKRALENKVAWHEHL